MGASGCHTVAPTIEIPDEWNNRLVATLEARSETDGPFLSLNAPDASSTTQFKANTDLASGTSRRVAALQGQGGVAYDFKTTSALDRNYYLNLSVNVFGVVFVTHSVAQAAAASGQSLDTGTYRVEVRSGERLVGGAIVAYHAAVSTGTWTKLPFSFRSEAPTLTEGQALTVRVIRYGGTADFSIGLAGAYQSYVEFRYYDTDPLAGTIYLEQGRMVTSGSEAMATPDFLEHAQAFADRPSFQALPQTLILLPPEAGDGPSLAVAAVALLPLALVALPRRPRRLVPALAVAMLAAAALSGCLTGESSTKVEQADESKPPEPTANVTYEEREDLKEAGRGEIQGRLSDETGLPIAGAHVSLLGTNQFQRSSKAGTFAFTNVSAGTFTMRIDAEKFLPFEEPVTVHAGQVTRLNITLPYAIAKAGNGKPHVHGNWGDADTQLVQSFSFLPWTCAYATTCTGAPELGQATGSWTCTGLDEFMVCETPIPIDVRKPIPVGTSVVEVTLKWTTTGQAPKELGLRIANNIPRTDVLIPPPQRFLPRGPADPIRIAIFPNEADPGHQAFTNWQFWLALPYTDAYAPAGQPVFQGGPVQFEVIAHKGVVPFEPAHRDFWGTNSTAPVLKNQAFDYACLGCSMPSAPPNSDYGVRPGKGMFVPPGTKEIQGEMTWTHTYLGSTSLVEWNLWYKPANIPPGETQKYLKKAPGTRSGNKLTFTIPVAPEEADQFYQSSSNWGFYPGDDQPDVSTVSANGLLGYPTKFTFNANAIKDPSYADS
ncbi:MAG: carboxypeptidase regulatory-like domain-containing protein [Euryarchaeota archaeon]|nr:carboxypeptidase regulatory-like domain-containing protein [Euryarchaeota archaeon]